ncbi:MAG: hypothetical protein KDB82_05330 [Planctomycetes bacterium]|nr:hypothetical protein [Planctomycetota bacterium]
MTELEPWNRPEKRGNRREAEPWNKLAREHPRSNEPAPDKPAELKPGETEPREVPPLAVQKQLRKLGIDPAQFFAQAKASIPPEELGPSGSPYAYDSPAGQAAKEFVDCRQRRALRNVRLALALFAAVFTVGFFGFGIDKLLDGVAANGELSGLSASGRQVDGEVVGSSGKARLDARYLAESGKPVLVSVSVRPSTHERFESASSEAPMFVRLIVDPAAPSSAMVFDDFSYEHGRMVDNLIVGCLAGFGPLSLCVLVCAIFLLVRRKRRQTQTLKATTVEAKEAESEVSESRARLAKYR